MARLQGPAGRPRGVITLMLLAIVAVTILLALTQGSIARSGGLGWDGIEYHRLASAYIDQQPLAASAPFAYRIGTPILAGTVSRITGLGLIPSFRLVNITAALAYFALLYAYLRVTAANRLWSSALVLVALTAWMMPLRFVLFYPVQSDPVPMCLFLGALLLIEARMRARASWPDVAALVGVVVVGGLFREQMALIALAGVAQILARHRDARAIRQVGCLFAGIAVPILITHRLADAGGAYSYVSAARGSLEDHALFHIVLSSYRTFGVGLALALVFLPRTLRWLLSEPYRWVAALGTVGLAWLGGSDTERFLAWALPVVFAAAAHALTRQDWSLLKRNRKHLGLALATVVAVASAGFFQPLRDAVDPFDLTTASLLRDHHAFPFLATVNAPTFVANATSFAPNLFNMIAFAQWVLVTITLALLLRPGLLASARTAFIRRRAELTTWVHADSHEAKEPESGR